MEMKEYIEKIKNIQKKMGWTDAEIFKILKDNFAEKDNFDFPESYNTFTKQYCNRGGSPKNFRDYYDYIYLLPDVKEVLSKPLNTKFRNLVSFSLIIILMVALLYTQYDPNNKMKIIFSKNYDFKECQNRCIKSHPAYRIDDKNISLNDFKIIRDIFY